mmetsp:Transcript_24455/g.58100  ORF Transcript_24455/g.58100 Transcript_24455/m.58100 type:complete len:102 (-) Transcript_24455:69-374(-)
MSFASQPKAPDSTFHNPSDSTFHAASDQAWIFQAPPPAPRGGAKGPWGVDSLPKAASGVDSGGSKGAWGVDSLPEGAWGVESEAPWGVDSLRLGSGGVDWC